MLMTLCIHLVRKNPANAIRQLYQLGDPVLKNCSGFFTEMCDIGCAMKLQYLAAMLLCLAALLL